MSLWEKTTLGRTGLRTSRLGIASSFGVGEADLARAFERGINYFYWGSIRREPFGKGVATLAARHRTEMLVVVQSYTRAAWMMRGSLERALRKLRTDYTDILLLGWWNSPPPPRILDAARALVEAGKARHVMVSCHHRPTFKELVAIPNVGAIMVRYNAAHPGAEEEVFPALGPTPPGVVAYTATRWGSLLDSSLTPPGEATPKAVDCYRFALSSPAVNVCLTGPKNGEELDQALGALDRGPMAADELGWMKRVGKTVRAAAMGKSGNPMIQIVDRVFSPRTPASPQ